MEIRLKDKIYLPNRVYKKIDLSASFFAASLSPFFSISRALHCATYKYIPSLQYNRENKLPRLIKRERESDTLEPVTLDLLHARALSSTIAFIYTYILYSYDGASASARIIEIARARESTRREEAAAAWKEGAREKKREKQQQRRQLLRQGERGMSLGAAAAAAGGAADVKTTFFARARSREREKETRRYPVRCSGRSARQFVEIRSESFYARRGYHAHTPSQYSNRAAETRLLRSTHIHTQEWVREMKNAHTFDLSARVWAGYRANSFDLLLLWLPSSRSRDESLLWVALPGRTTPVLSPSDPSRIFDENLCAAI